MSILMAAFLGLIQGLTEFLPVSSSGHLNLLQALLHMDTDHQLLFNIMLHLGTLGAVLIVFWKDWIQMILHPIKNKTLLLLFIASLPALVAKVFFSDQLDYLEASNALLGVCFLFTGLLLMLTQWISLRNVRLNQETHEVGIWHALVMGVLQAVGMLPSVSRSGATIFGGVATKLDRKTAAKFSFMMSMPAIIGSFLSEGYKGYKAGAFAQSGDLLAIVVGMVVAGVVGYISIRFMLKIITRISLNWFALYVVALGLLVIVLQVMGIITDVPQVAATAAKGLSGLL